MGIEPAMCAEPNYAEPELTRTARGLIGALPRSVELPAGAGKTELLTETARVLVAEHSGAVLVLTHTHAGVHAVRTRLAKAGVTSGCDVSTIASFAFGLARSYPVLGGLAVPPVPVAADSAQYVQAATRVAGSRHIRDVVAASYTHLLVDEYQDCSQDQHGFVCTLADAIGGTGVFGDRMQAIFGFDAPLVSWLEVQARFPDYPVPVNPWRWQGTNPQLGVYLSQLRPTLVAGDRINLADGAAARVHYETVDFRTRRARLQAIAQHAWPEEDTVVVIGGVRPQHAREIAADMRGVFTVMEDVGGAFMVELLDQLAGLDPSQYAAWLGRAFKICFCGHGSLKPAYIGKLEHQKAIGKLKGPGVEPVMLALDTVLAEPTLASVASAMDLIRHAPQPRLHSHEAWTEMSKAVRAAAGRSDPSALTDELARARDRIRRVGRRPRRRVVSRTLLIKGLEFDHVIIADIDQLRDQWSLYVALSRARKSIYIMGSSPEIIVKETRLAPRVVD